MDYILKGQLTPLESLRLENSLFAGLIYGLVALLARYGLWPGFLPWLPWACALAGRGIGQGDTVAVMLPNIPAMLEAHFAVPMIGAVLNALNVRLDAEAIAFMLAHGEAKVLIADREFHDVVHAAVAMLDHPPLIIDVDDPEYGEGQPVSTLDYEALLAEGDPEFDWQWPADEWQAIALNYTSGTTGNPKGVVYHHRGAYLNSLGNQMVWAIGNHPV